MSGYRTLLDVDKNSATVTLRDNLPPIVDAGDDDEVDGGSTVTLSGSATDPDTDRGDHIAGYRWTQVSGTAVTLSSTDRASTSFTAPATTSIAQVLVFQLEAWDNVDSDDIGLDRVTITVRPKAPPTPVNQPPVANAGIDQQVFTDASVTLSGSGTDLDGSIASYAWVQVDSDGDALTSGAVSLTNANRASASFTAPSSPAELYFRLTVTDDGTPPLTGTDIVKITVVDPPPPNMPPVVSASGPTEPVAGGATVRLTATASDPDPDGSIASYLWEEVTTTGITLSGSTTANASFTAPAQTDNPQTIVVRVTVTDDGTPPLSAFAEVVVTVKENPPPPEPDPIPPIANAGSTQTVSGGSPVTLDGTGSSDPDGDIVSYRWRQVRDRASGTQDDPAVTLSNANTATATFTAPAEIVGVTQSMTFELTVTDDTTPTALTGKALVVVLVLPGEPQKENPIAVASTTTPEVDGGDTVTITGTGTDPDGTIVSYSWRQVSGTTIVLADSNRATTTFVAPAATSTNQVIELELTVTDNDGLMGTSKLVITVRPRRTEIRNKPPRVNAGTTHTVNGGDTVTLRGSATDVDGTVESYAWTQVSGPSVVLADSTSATTTFVAPAATDNVQTIVLRLTATDDDGDDGENTVTILVRARKTGTENTPPVADAGTDQFVDGGVSVTLTGTGTDVDGTVESYAWTQVSGTAVTLTAGTGSDNHLATFTAPAAISTLQTLVFQLTVTDDDGATDTDTVTIGVFGTIAPPPDTNRPPVASAGSDQTVDGGSTVRLRGSATDTDGTIASYAWTQVSGPSVSITGASSANASFTAPAGLGSVQTLVFRLTATDDDGATGSDDIVIRIRAVEGANRPPTADAGPNQTVQGGARVTLLGSGTDEDGTIASYRWTQRSGTRVRLSSTTVATPTFTAPTVSRTATLVFRLTVTDDDGATGTDDVTVTVNPATRDATIVKTVINRNPVISSGNRRLTLLQNTPYPDVSALSEPSSARRYFRQLVLDTRFATQSVSVDFSPRSDIAAGGNTEMTTAWESFSSAIVIEAGTLSLEIPGPTASGNVRTDPTEPYLYGVPSAKRTEFGTFIAALAALDADVRNSACVTFRDGLPRPKVPPLVQAGGNQVVEGGSSVTLTGIATDTDGTIASYLWTQTSGPTVQLSSPVTPSTSFTAPEATDRLQTLTFRLTVADSDNLSVSDEVSVIVLPTGELGVNPYANAGIDQQVSGGSLVTLEGSAYDPDGIINTYRWSQISGTRVTVRNEDRSTATFDAPEAQAHVQNLTFRLTVTDNDGRTDTDDVVVSVYGQITGTPTVRETSRPIANAGHDHTVNGRDRVELRGSGIDLDGTIESYAWTQVSGTAVELVNPASSTASFIAPLSEATEQTLSFQLEVTDNDGFSALDRVNVVVRRRGSVFLPSPAPATFSNNAIRILYGMLRSDVFGASEPKEAFDAASWRAVAELGDKVILGESNELWNQPFPEELQRQRAIEGLPPITEWRQLYQEHGFGTEFDRGTVNSVPPIRQFTFDGWLNPAQGFEQIIETLLLHAPGVVMDENPDGTIYLDGIDYDPETPLEEYYADLELVLDSSVVVSEYPVNFSRPGIDERLNQITLSHSNANEEYGPNTTIFPVTDSPAHARLKAEDNGLLLETSLTLEGANTTYTATNIGAHIVNLSRRVKGSLVVGPIGIALKVGMVLPCKIDYVDYADEDSPAEHSVFESAVRIMSIVPVDHYRMHYRLGVVEFVPTDYAPNIDDKQLIVAASAPDDASEGPDRTVLFTDLAARATLAEWYPNPNQRPEVERFELQDNVTVFALTDSATPSIPSRPDEDDQNWHTARMHGLDERILPYDAQSTFNLPYKIRIEHNSVGRIGFYRIRECFVNGGFGPWVYFPGYSLIPYLGQESSRIERAPDARAGADFETYSGETARVDGSASSDPDGQIVSHAWTQREGPIVPIVNANSARASFVAPQVDENGAVIVLRLTVTDNTGMMDTDDIFITVKRERPPTVDMNRAPDAVATTRTPTVNAGDLVVLDGSGSSDPDNDPITFEWTEFESYSNIELVDADKAFAGFVAPPSETEQTYRFLLEVSDGRLSGIASVVITVRAKGDNDPIANAGPDQRVAGGSTVQLAGTGYDTDGTVVSYLWERTAGPAIVLADASDRRTTFTAPDRTGADQTITLRLTVTDNAGNTATDTVDIVVAANVPPTANAGGDQRVDGGATVRVSGSGTDEDGEIVSYAWSHVSGPAVRIANANMANASFTAPEATRQTQLIELRLTVTDDSGGTGTDDITIAVRDKEPEPPVVNAGRDQIGVRGGTAITLRGTAYDPDGFTRSSITKIEWKQVARQGDPVVTLDGADTLIATFVAPAETASAQRLEFVLTATDSDGLSDSDNVIVQVREKSPIIIPPVIPRTNPIAEAGDDQTVIPCSTVTLDGRRSRDTNEGGRIDTFQWEQVSGPTVSLSNANRSVATFKAPEKDCEDAQVLRFDLTVKNNYGKYADDLVSITVPENRAPVAHAGSNQVIGPEEIVTLNGLGTDIDDVLLDYQWERISGPEVTLSNADKPTASFGSPPRTDEVQNWTFRLTVTDPCGASGTADVNVRLDAKPKEPDEPEIPEVETRREYRLQVETELTSQLYVCDPWSQDPFPDTVRGFYNMILQCREIHPVTGVGDWEEVGKAHYTYETAVNGPSGNPNVATTLTGPNITGDTNIQWNLEITDISTSVPLDAPDLGITVPRGVDAECMTFAYSYWQGSWTFDNQAGTVDTTVEYEKCTLSHISDDNPLKDALQAAWIAWFTKQLERVVCEKAKSGSVVALIACVGIRLVRKLL